MPDASEYWMLVGLFLTYILTMTVIGFLGIGDLSDTCAQYTVTTMSPDVCLDGIDFSEGLLSIFVNPFTMGTTERFVVLIGLFIPLIIIVTVFVLNLGRGR